MRRSTSNILLVNITSEPQHLTTLIRTLRMSHGDGEQYLLSIMYETCGGYSLRTLCALVNQSVMHVGFELN